MTKYCYLFNGLVLLTLSLMFFPMATVLNISPKLFDIPTVILITYFSSYFLPLHYKDKLNKLLTHKKSIALIILFVFFNFFGHQLTKYLNYEFSSMDFSHYDYTIWNTITLIGVSGKRLNCRR